MEALKESALPLSLTVTVTVFPLREPVVADVGVFGFWPNSNSCASAAISARRQVHSALVVIRVPFMKVNGSGKNGFCDSDDAGGIGGRLHPPPVPLPFCIADTV